MIRTTLDYSLHQVTGAGSRGFSGDRALARRKPLDAVAVAIASRMGGRKEHEAKRSVPSPATLPVGETRGFGGKAPIGSVVAFWCTDCVIGLWGSRSATCPSIGQTQRNGKLNTVGSGCSCFRAGASISFQEGHDLNTSAFCRVACVGCVNGHVEANRHDQIIAILSFVELPNEEVVVILVRSFRDRRVSVCASTASLGRKLGNRINYFRKCLFHEIFQRKHLGAFAIRLQHSQLILAQSVSVTNSRAQRNVRGAVFVSRPPLVTGELK